MALIPNVILAVNDYLNNGVPMCEYWSGVLGVEIKARNFQGNCSEFDASKYELRKFACRDESPHECKCNFDCTYLKEYSTFAALQNLEHLRGAPLEYIAAYNFTGNLEPLRGAPLEVVIMHKFIGSIAPLSGAPLKCLEVYGITRNLEPLRGAPLEKLTAIEFNGNLEPLRGAPLMCLELHTFTGSLEPLRGAPLDYVDLFSFNGDLEPLFECKTIKYLYLLNFRGDFGPLAYADVSRIYHRAFDMCY